MNGEKFECKNFGGGKPNRRLELSSYFGTPNSLGVECCFLVNFKGFPPEFVSLACDVIQSDIRSAVDDVIKQFVDSYLVPSHEDPSKGGDHHA